MVAETYRSMRLRPMKVFVNKASQDGALRCSGHVGFGGSFGHDFPFYVF